MNKIHILKTSKSWKNNGCSSSSFYYGFRVSFCWLVELCCTASWENTTWENNK